MDRNAPPSLRNLHRQIIITTSPLGWQITNNTIFQLTNKPTDQSVNTNNRLHTITWLLRWLGTGCQNNSPSPDYVHPLQHLPRDMGWSLESPIVTQIKKVNWRGGWGGPCHACRSLVTYGDHVTQPLLNKLCVQFSMGCPFLQMKVGWMGPTGPC